MSRRVIPVGALRRPLAALGTVAVLLLAWVAAPDLLGDELVGSVTPQDEPLRVATDVDVSGLAMDMPSAGTAGVAPPSAALAPTESASPESAPIESAPPAPSGAPPTAGGPQTTGGTADIPRQGPGTYQPAPGGTAVVGAGDALVTYSVEVESGVPFDPAQIAAEVDQILGDPRSWIGLGRWRVQRVEAGADARIVVATPGTVDDLCYPLQTAGTYSCRNGPFVVLNADRWATGAQSWGTDVEGYRGYLVNHEFGHFLGFSHTPCTGAGLAAPVMLQQTKGLDGCAANAWPTVTGG